MFKPGSSGKLSAFDLLRVDRLDSRFHSQIYADMQRQCLHESKHVDADKEDAFPKWKCPETSILFH